MVAGAWLVLAAAGNAGEQDAAPVAPAPTAAPAAPTPSLVPAAGEFAAFWQGKMHLLLCEAGMLEAQTLGERGAEKVALMRRQGELEAWFARQQRAVGEGQLQTEQDKQNYRDFRTVMANAEFLKLEVDERRQYVTRVDAHEAAFARYFGASLEEFTAGGGAEDTARVRGFLAQRLAQHVGVGMRYFGRGAETTIAAVYLPLTRSVYVNVNFMAAKERPFIGAVEHELWHHLVPTATPATVAQNLQWEGFNEALAKHWAAYFYAHLPADYKLREQQVSYPLQVAYTSLFLGSERLLTLSYLTGQRSEADFLAAFAAGGPPWRATVAAQWRERLRVDAAHSQRLAALLSAWGWKEDDGAPLKLDAVLENGQLVPAKLTALFTSNRQLLNDLGDAQCVLWLQDLQAQYPAQAYPRSALDLPPNLWQNFTDVYEYSRHPRLPFRPRKEGERSKESAD